MGKAVEPNRKLVAIVIKLQSDLATVAPGRKLVSDITLNMMRVRNPKMLHNCRFCAWFRAVGTV